MNRFKKNIFLAILVIVASCVGYYLQKAEQQSYILDRMPMAGEGEQIYSVVQNDGENDHKININTASKEELMTLHGIGEVRAERIIEYRTINGNFEVVEDIMKIPGIGKKTFDGFKDDITI